MEEKQLYGHFKRLINNVSHDKTWAWLRKGNFKRETESLLMAAQNSAIRTNHIKARIDKTQQNSKCRRCGDRDETINHIISECSKLAHGIKLKECEKKDKYLDFAREMKKITTNKLWNMKVTIVPIVVGAFGAVSKGLLKGLEDLEIGRGGEIIQITALLKTVRILRRVLET